MAKIYSLKHPITNEVRYIGITTKTLSERLSGHMSGINAYKGQKNDWIKSLKNKGLKPVICLITEVDDTIAIETEKLHIKLAKHLGFRLTNNSDGGDGVLGYKMTESTKRKISKARKGKPLPQREKCLATRRNNILSKQEQYNQLRADGLTYAQIGDIIGLNRHTVAKYFGGKS